MDCKVISEVVNEDEAALADEVRKLGRLVRTGHRWQMATAESCTGGAIAAALTAAPGASEWFAGSLVTYDTQWKCRYLGVSPETVASFGVASCQVVRQMLEGLQERFGVKAGCAVSGIAGPTGAEEGKPVGTVYIGAMAGGVFHVRRFNFDGDREAVRGATVRCAIRMLIELLENRE